MFSKSVNRLVALLMCVISLNFYAQDPFVDSLKIALKNVRNDTSKCNILMTLIENVSEEEWPMYSEELKNFSELKLTSISEKDPLHKFYLKNLAAAIYNIGDIAQQEGDYTKALEYFKKSLIIDQKLGNKSSIAYSLNSIGGMYDYMGNIPKAIEFYSQALKLREELGEDKNLAYLYNNMGTIYDNQGDTTAALKFYFKALALQERVLDIKGAANTLNSLGFLYSNNGHQDKAIFYYQKGLKMYEEIGDERGIALLSSNIGSIYFENNDINKSRVYLERSIVIYEKLNDKSGIANCYNNRARIYFRKKNYQKALELCSKSLAISKSIGKVEYIRNSSLVLSEIYKETKNYKSAFENYELYILMRDSLNNQQTKKTAIKSQLKYEYEKQAAADSVKHAEEQKVKNAQLQAQAASLKQEKTQRYALYGGLLLVIGFSVFVFNRFKVTQKQKKVIEEQKVLVDNAYEQLHEKNKEVMDSITYARRIQRALLTPEIYIDRALNKLQKKS